jgi:DNA-binding LacI/PurR family transcriptional regulator
MRSAGLDTSRVYRGDWSSATGLAAGRQIVADGLPTAVFAANDQMALGLLSAFGAAGVGVPGDVSVAGFDDVPDAEFFQPGLTTMRQDFAALAARGVGVLERILAGERASSVCISGELVIRESTAPPRHR